MEPEAGRIDQGYLDRMRSLAEMLGRHDVGVLVDSHEGYPIVIAPIQSHARVKATGATS